MTDRPTIPRPRPSSPIERIFPQVEQERRDAGDLATADHIRHFLAQWPIYLAARGTQISAELDSLLGYLPARAPSYASPGMRARTEAALRCVPLRNASGVAGRDPMRWGAA